MKDHESIPGPGSGFHRRDFLKGSGAAAAATALATGTSEAEAAQKKKVVGPGPTGIKLKVNGKEHTVKVEPRMTLLEVLRYQLNLTGAKPVSTDGVSCGASTVIIDGKPAIAGATLALKCVGKDIQTVEAIAASKDSSVATCFVHQDGMQCGFCTPGFVVAVHAFLKKTPNATKEQIRAGLNGNLCRCGTYANVIEAALEAVKGGGSNG